MVDRLGYKSSFSLYRFNMNYEYVKLTKQGIEIVYYKGKSH